MKLARRGKREVRIVLWVSLASAFISGWFGYAVRPAESEGITGILLGVANSLVIATPILVFEILSARPGRVRRLRRLPLALLFALKVAFYLVVIIGGLAMVGWLFTGAKGEHQVNTLSQSSIVFAVVMSVIGNLIFEMGGLLGFGTLKNLLTGRYIHPRQEERTFLLIDMTNSTGLAERLGPVRFHELLNDFFADTADAALECGAEIHKYVGDEVILTWSGTAALDSGDCMACPFVAYDLLAARGEHYRRRYGIVPQFRAALHWGEIVTGEIGDVRREIAYVGDTLNVAARLLDAAKTLGRRVLVSTELLSRATLPRGLVAEPLDTLDVRGRVAPLPIAALERRPAA